jgi:hypothetical protein
MPKWRAGTWVMLGVALAFNGLMAWWFYSPHSCPPTTADEFWLTDCVAGWFALFGMWLLGDGVLVVIGVIWAVLAFVRSRSAPAEESWEPAAPAWLVAGPGADLMWRLSDREPHAHLEAGTVVWEVERGQGQVRVTTPEGLEGWVDADRLEPTVQPTGDGEGGGDG